MCTDLDLGFNLTERWRASGEVVCAAPPLLRPWWRTAPALVSSVSVHRVRQHRHGHDDAYYVIRNLYVNPRKRVRVASSPTGGPRLVIERGAFRAACRPTPSWAAAPAPYTLASIKNGLTFGSIPSDVPRDEIPTLLVSRDGARNIFHALTDVLNAYLMRRMFPYQRVVFLDDHEDGPLMPLWRLLSTEPVRRFHELPDRCVFAAAAFSPPGGTCFLWKNHWEARSECRREAPLLQAFRQFVLDGLGLLSGPASSRVTLVRRVRSEGRAATRQIENEGTLLRALEDACGAPAVQAVDFAELPFAEQIRAVLDTRVLIGVSGAGLTNLVWLDPGRAVLEIVAAPSYQPACFANLAAWIGVRYAAWHDPSPAPELAQRGAGVPALTVDARAISSLAVSLLD